LLNLYDNRARAAAAAAAGDYRDGAMRWCVLLGGAVQLDPSFARLTPQLLSTFETNMW